MKPSYEIWRDELNGTKPDLAGRLMWAAAAAVVLVGLSYGFGAFWGWW